MAKFFLTNNEEWYLKAKQQIADSDFKLAFDYAEKGVYVLTTHKLKMKNKNAYCLPNGDFVIATGTAIYKESLDYSKVLNDYTCEAAAGGGALRIRHNTIGQYAYVISNSVGITIFGERAAAYDIYYYTSNDGHYFVSNVLYDMASIIREKISLDDMNVVEYACTSNNFGGGTIFKEIRRLEGEEQISIKSGILQVEPIEGVSMFPLLKDAPIAEEAKKLASRLSYKASVIYKVFGTPCISMTGGLDSRTLLAAFLSAGVKPKLMYGRSNTYIASPIKEDEIALQKLAKKYDLQYEIQEWDTTNPERSWDKYLRRYGLLYMHWAASEAIFSSYEEMPGDVFVFGFGGECFRNSFPIPQHAEPFTLDEVTDEYGMYCYCQNSANYETISQYKSFIRKKLKDVALKYNLDPNRIVRDDAFYFEYEFTKVGATTPVNLLNQIHYIPSLFFEADCLECARLSYDQMDGARLMLYTMQQLEPSILDVEFLSRCCIHIVDFNKMILLPFNRDYHRTGFELFLKKIYLKNQELLKPVRNLYKSIENRFRVISSNNYEVEENDTQNQKKYIQYDVTFVDPRPLSYYCMLNKALENLKFQPR